ncbi:MAG: ABC transporter, partial [Betaproteobacteria bacterium HGW-Betaproteobacteria-8]
MPSHEPQQREIMPAETPVKARKISSLRDIWPFLRPYRKQMLLAFVLLSLASATLLLVPLAFRDLIDFGFGQKPARTSGALTDSLNLNSHFA